MHGFGGPSYVMYSGCSGVCIGVVRAVVRSDVSIAFDKVCAVVVLNKNRVQVLGFVGQTVVLVASNLCSCRQVEGSYISSFV